jgi:AcrR family transcriptional regulator
MNNMNHDGPAVKDEGQDKSSPGSLLNVVTSAAATAAAVVNETRSARGAIDGRKKRWDEHKKARREEFVDAAIGAIRREGPNIGMETVAAELQVSKTVLYRHFTDKSDLIGAILTKIAQTVLLPPLLAELEQVRDDFDQARGVIGAYVNSIAAEPSLYSFVFAHNQEVGDQESVVATTERVVAEALSALVGDRLRTMGMDSGGAQPWAYGVVGMVQLATHWWVDNRTMSAEALVDYLTMLVWGGLEGIIKAEGSPVKFAPPARPAPSLRLLGQPPTPETSEEHHG